MRLFHRTSIGEARGIMREGFVDAKWRFEVRGDRDVEGEKRIGVWLTDRVLADDEGPPGDAQLAVDVGLSEETLSAFELEGVFWDARLFVLPAEVLNSHARVRIQQVDPRTSWWYEAPRPEE
ncbi:MAG: hypothetical protein OER21_04615 [Gemmatimonadota bacterium]|nr:hypothetical protein [Gemmatimonadota bacterium]